VAGGTEFHLIGVRQAHIEQTRKDDTGNKYNGNENNGNLARTISEHTPPLVLMHIRFCMAAVLEYLSIAILIKRVSLDRWDGTSTLIYMQNFQGNKGI
jgi:hypothetical protein